MSIYDAPTPDACMRVGLILANHRETVESAPFAISTTLALANDLIHESELSTSDPTLFATQRNISALVQCAKLATCHLEGITDLVLRALDSTEDKA